MPYVHKPEEITGMSNLQYADHLKGLVRELELVKKLGISEDAAERIDGMISQYKSTIAGVNG